ncbi:DUF3253 domain-containing protein [Acidisoma sp. C75]
MIEKQNEAADRGKSAEPPRPIEAGARYEETILGMAQQHGVGKSFTPSDVAQALAEDWRPLLGHIRAAARRLAEAGRIEILRHGKPVEPAALRGVIRLRLKAAAPADAATPEPTPPALG